MGIRSTYKVKLAYNPCEEKRVSDFVVAGVYVFKMIKVAFSSITQCFGLV